MAPCAVRAWPEGLDVAARLKRLLAETEVG